MLLNISARGRRVAIFVFCRPRRRRPMTVFVIVAIFNSSTVIEEERRHVIERYFRDFYAFFMRFLCVSSIFLNKSQIFGVISLIVQPPSYHLIITLGANPPPYR